MYKVKPFYSSAPLEDLPGCMYRLPGVHAAPGVDAAAAAAAASQGEDATLLELEQRQEAMLRRLHKLRNEVDDLVRAVLVPSGPQSSAPAAGASSSPQLRSCPAHHHQHDGQLDAIFGMGGGVVRDIVVVASPARPPLSVIVLHELLRHRYRVLTAVHVHSNATTLVPPALRLCLGPPSANDSRSDHQLVLTIIWKDVPRPELRVNVTHACPVHGEGNVARFLWALAGAAPSDPVARTQDDAWVDVAALQLLPASPKERASVLKALNAELGRPGRPWLGGAEFSLADVVMWSALAQSGGPAAMGGPPHVARWRLACEAHPTFQTAKGLL
ncbi:aminoacyl tRNA synthase complex-interacting multifunctional protein 2 [Lampetra fluviatilis]